ncbi:hypothetical protein [Streptomyces hydrogenans]
MGRAALLHHFRQRLRRPHRGRLDRSVTVQGSVAPGLGMLLYSQGAEE